MCVHGIPLGIVENVCDRTLPLLAGDEFFGADAIPLASVAKAIEDFRECQILFVPHEFPHQQYSHLFTHKLKLVFLDSAGKETLTRDSEESEELSWLRHSIFYLPASNRRDQQELLRERWYVLHELGHIWLHWSDNNRPECEENVDWIPDGDGHECYIVRFKQEQEQEADAFATLLVAHRLAPGGRTAKLEVDDHYARALDLCKDFLQGPKWNKEEFGTSAIGGDSSG